MLPINTKDNKTFEDIKHFDENGVEFWLARELQIALNYAKWENFNKVIKTAQIACKISQNNVSDHFPEVRKTVPMPSGANPKTIVDYKLSRYACYLIVMNGDPRKSVIALGQTYFAVKTRRQEYQELFNQLTEDDKRLFLRGDIKQKNMLLFDAAKKAGIETNFEYAEFQDSGYMGLYGGLKENDIAKRKKLDSKKQDILDYMGSAELAANLFRITQTEETMKNNNVSTPLEANKTHHKIGTIVREAIEKAGNTLPENLPTPEKSIKQIESEKKNQLKHTKKKTDKKDEN